MTSRKAEYRRPVSISFATVTAAVLVCVAVLAGFALRMQGLATQSLWFDEAMSVVFAVKPPSELLALLVTEDIHPPLYPMLLHFWIDIAGSSEYSTRFLSVFAGVALIPLFYVAGNRLSLLAGGDRRARFSLPGLVGSLLAASSAFYIGYSQETRNYMLVTALGLLSSYLLLRAVPSSRRRPWLLYAVATCAAVYTNYTAFLLIVFQGLFVFSTRPRPEGTRRRWMIASLATLLAFMPWIGFAFDQVTRINDYWPGTLKLGSALRSTLVQLLAGGGAETPSLGPQLALVAGLLALGVLALALGASRAKGGQHSLFLMLYFVVPSVTLFAVAYTRPKFDPRYLLVATPAFYLILAWGMSSLLGSVRARMPVFLRIVLPAVGLIAVLGVIAVSTVYGEPAKVKADYRSLVSYIDNHAEPGDAVVVLMNAPHPYIYYSNGTLPWYPMERVDDFGGAITRLNKLADGHRRLWFILWQREWEDPADYVMHVMEDQATEVKIGASFTGLDLRLFELSPNRPFNYYPPTQQGIEANFGGVLDFWGWMSNKTSIVRDEFQTEVAAGEKMRVDVHWIPQKRLATDPKITITLVDADGHEWARTDEVMGNAFFQPTKWKVKEIIHDRHQLEIPSGTPPGTYTLRLSLYDPVSLKPLNITTASGSALGAVLTLGTIQVKTSNSIPVSVSAAPAFSWQIGGVTWDATRAGAWTDLTVPGDRIEVTVGWRLHQQVSADYSARIVLLDSSAKPVTEETVPLSAPYPNSKWRAGEEVVSKYWLQLPVDLEKGQYWIGVAPVAPGGQSGSRVTLAQAARLDVLTPDSTYELPTMQHPLGIRIGSQAELAGYDLSATKVNAGGKIILTLYWRDIARFDRSYKVFNHVIDDSNTFAGQRDAVPVADTRPTTTWRKGEVLVDRYEIPISAEAKPGKYNLKVGMYAQEGGQRLPVTTPDGKPAGDSVTLTEISVTP